MEVLKTLPGSSLRTGREPANSIIPVSLARAAMWSWMTPFPGDSADSRSCLRLVCIRAKHSGRNIARAPLEAASRARTEVDSRFRMMSSDVLVWQTAISGTVETVSGPAGRIGALDSLYYPTMRRSSVSPDAPPAWYGPASTGGRRSHDSGWHYPPW